MSVDPEKAIEQLAEYRKDSQVKKDTASRKKQDISPLTRKIRNFYIRFHWVNAVFTAMLVFISLIGGTAGLPGLAKPFWLIIFIFNAFLFRQLFVTIDRLDESDGRFTIFDDVFVITLLMISVLELLPILDLDTVLFFIMFGILVVIWFGQIYFINYKKPDLSYVPPVHEMVTSEEAQTFTQRVISFFTPRRIIVLALGLVLALVLSIPHLF